MGIYNISKTAQHGHQGNATIVDISYRMNEISRQLNNLNNQPQNKDPQLEQQRQQQIEQLKAEWKHLWKKQGEAYTISRESGRISVQEQIMAILEGDEAVLSQMSAEDYVATRDAFLKSVPKMQRGETIEMYSDRVREYIYQYNTNGDLVEPYTKMVINNINIKNNADRQRKEEAAAHKQNNLERNQAIAAASAQAIAAARASRQRKRR
jgi:hypothetical protein